MFLRGFDFERRRNKALGMFQRAIEDMGELVADAEERAAMLTVKAEALQHEADTLSTDAAKAKLTLGKLSGLLS